MPKSRTLIKRGSTVDCNVMLPVGYKIDGIWYHVSPKLIRAPTPNVLQPMAKPTWNYEKPEHLATSGIYSRKDLEKLRNRIMFPAEKQALLNSIARGVAGENIPAGTLNMMSLLDENTLKELANNTAQRIWRGFIDFGSVSAGILTIMLIIKILKWVLDTCLHGHALHGIYGCGFYLITAVWGTLAYILIHKGNARQREDKDIEKGINEDQRPEPAVRQQPPSIEIIGMQPRSTVPSYQPTTSDGLYSEIRRKFSFGKSNKKKNDVVLEHVDYNMYNKLTQSH